MFTATTAGGQLAVGDGHPWSWTEVVQAFRSAPDDCRMSWTPAADSPRTPRTPTPPVPSPTGHDQSRSRPGPRARRRRHRRRRAPRSAHAAWPCPPRPRSAGPAPEPARPGPSARHHDDRRPSHHQPAEPSSGGLTAGRHVPEKGPKVPGGRVPKASSRPLSPGLPPRTRSRPRELRPLCCHPAAQCALTLCQTCPGYPGPVPKGSGPSRWQDRRSPARLPRLSCGRPVCGWKCGCPPPNPP